MQLAKQAADPRPAYDMTGCLFVSPDGWLLLSVPNALVRGVFSAIDQPGVELPPWNGTRQLVAHISVMRPEELAGIGGADKVTERGKRFSYRIGGLVTVKPDGWKEVETAWLLQITSPQLQALRRSYGLSSLPNDGKYAFHVTVAIRRRGVLGRNEKAKKS